MWSPQIDFLTKGYRVLRYDTRGHGGSETPKGPYAMDDLVGDVIGLMDHFDIGKASFMGLSMGAMTGMGLALTAPERFDRMVLADGRADAPGPFRAMWDDRVGKVEDGGLAAIAEGTLASWFTEDWRTNNAATLEQVRAMILGNSPDGYIACCRALQGLDYLRHLGNVSVPSLYIGGAQDMGAAPAVMQAMADATPGARYVEIPDAAHVANINAPEAFNAAIAEFLGL
jgi:3-oxoadipate enol-lactonase